MSAPCIHFASHHASDAAAAAAASDAWCDADLRRRLVCFARMLSGDAHACEDLVHDAVMQITEARRQGEDIVDPAAYARTSIRHACYRRASLRQRERMLPDAEAWEAVSATFDEGPGWDEACQDLQRHLSRLRSDDRKLLEDRYVLGRSLADLAVERGQELETIRKRMQRLKEALRDRLARWGRP